MSDPPPGWGRKSTSLLLGLAVLVWASRTVLPGDLAYSQLDRSWCMGLGHALAEGWRAGVDYVFTFGPLGCLSTGVYLPELFWIKVLVWEGLFQLLAAVVLAAAGLSIESRGLRVLYFLAILLQPLDPDAHAFLTIFAAFVWITRGDERLRTSIALVAAVLAGLSLVKFTWAVAAAACVLASAAVLWRRSRRREGIALFFAFFALAACAWWSCGQSLSDLPAYVARSLELSGGYSEAMSRPGPPWVRPIALALLAVALLATVLHARGSLPALVFPAAMLWIAYKAGFVRALDHTPTCFQFAATAPLLLDAAVGSRASVARASTISRLACVALGLLGLFAAGGPQLPGQSAGPFRRVAAHARALFAPRAFRSRLEASEAADARSTDLPRTREVVGNGTIDMVPNLQILLFRNQLEWRPRPVFQSYACFTAGLLELNARFLESERAPDFVLFSLGAIDFRLPTMDDASALQVLARDYEPVLQEKGLLLLRSHRRPGARGGTEVSLSRETGFGDWVSLRGLTGDCHLLALDIRPTLAGRLRTVLDAAPPLEAELELDSGEIFVSRIVPGMMRSGVIVDPVLRNQEDWLSWCAAKPLPRPVGLRIRSPASPWMYEPSVGVRLLRADGIAPGR